MHSGFTSSSSQRRKSHQRGALLGDSSVSVYRSYSEQNVAYSSDPLHWNALHSQYTTLPIQVTPFIGIYYTASASRQFHKNANNTAMQYTVNTSDLLYVRCINALIFMKI